MKRSTLAAATVVALTAIGISAPAAVAGPSTHKHGPSAHANGHGSSAHGTGKLTNAQKKVRQAIKVEDRKLGQNLARATRHLGADDAAAVGANIAADRAALAALGTQLAAATTTDEVRAIATQVAGFRTENYHVAINGLRHVANVTGADAETPVDPETPADTETPADADVSTAAAAATDLLRGLTATSTKADRKAAHDAVAALDALIAPETDETETDETETDEVPSDPETDEPIV